MSLFEQITGAVGTVLNPVSTLIQNNAQKKAQQREFAHNKEMWNLANQYNSPEQQMARLKSAGLNPNLVYGNGSVVGNTSTSTPNYQAPQIQRLGLENLNPLNLLGQFLDLKQKSAQVDLTNEAINMKKSENLWIDTMNAQKLRQIFGKNQMIDDLLGRSFNYRSSRDKQTLNVDYKETGENKYLKSYQAQVLSAEQRNKLNQFQLDFMKTIPKEMQWLAPFLVNIFQSAVK